MEGGLSLDCEDMFKEITKKLYGEEGGAGAGPGVEFPAAERDEDRPEETLTAWGLAALMQGGVPPPGILQPNFAPRTDPAHEDRWTPADEPLAWAGSRVAAYNPAQRLFKCAECECVGFLARLAEHWLGTHAPAHVFHCPLPGCGYASGWARSVRSHLSRDHRADPNSADHLLRDNPALDDLTKYLARLKSKVESTPRRTTPPAEPTPPPAAAADAGKRYACPSCPYATDRRDLFTRHENIHRDEKPFHCYLCQKQFNRADHVKKHFLRMHREQPYDLNRIRRAAPPPTPVVNKPAPPPQQAATQPAPQPAPQPALHYYTKPPAEPPPPAPEYRPAPPPAIIKTERVGGVSSVVKQEQQVVVTGQQVTGQQITVGGNPAGSRRKGERRYACCYCAWSGADNWCLKRHLNTHLKPFACALCEYKAARAERLHTHVSKVHNKRACARCPHLADDVSALQHHMRTMHHIESRNIKVPSTGVRVVPAAGPGSFTGGAAQQTASQQDQPASQAVQRRRESRAGGAARLFGYLEASDGSGDEFEPTAAAALSEFASAPGSAGPAPAQYTRDKENTQPSHHTMHHDHCTLRY